MGLHQTPTGQAIRDSHDLFRETFRAANEKIQRYDGVNTVQLRVF